MKKEILDIILTSRLAKKPLAVITRVVDGMQWTFLENDNENHEVFSPLEIDTIKKSRDSFGEPKRFNKKGQRLAGGSKTNLLQG